jgi:hypothetical protein
VARLTGGYGGATIQLIMRSEIQIGENLDVAALRARLRKMTEEQLQKFGHAARYMVSPTANMGKPPLNVFVTQLAEARAEWQRRKRKKPDESSMSANKSG